MIDKQLTALKVEIVKLIQEKERLKQENKALRDRIQQHEPPKLTTILSLQIKHEGRGHGGTMRYMQQTAKNNRFNG